jgi:hypothetical protein
LPAWLSDALSRLASGGSFAVRQLYTDDEEVLFKAARPTLLNGIGRSDLADRAILLTLGPIGEEQRRCETELWREFELARAAILGALLDTAAHGLRAVGSVHLGRLPRMADFATLGHGLQNSADLLRVSVERSSDRIPKDGTGWAKNPRALAAEIVELLQELAGRCIHRLARPCELRCEGRVDGGEMIARLLD